ncbi:MAG: hypothetical protein OSB44_07465, partial [Verrucomicrobiales bacterium]|nr:hypothetical protein [Verrucomicrobiales bacterium]
GEDHFVAPNKSSPLLAFRGGHFPWIDDLDLDMHSPIEDPNEASSRFFQNVAATLGYRTKTPWNWTYCSECAVRGARDDQIKVANFDGQLVNVQVK